MRAIPAARSVTAAAALLFALSAEGCDTRAFTVSGTLRGSATLSALSVSAGSLTPVFTPNTTVYTDLVSFNTDQVTVTATPTTSGATLLINGNAVASGTASPAINLVVGANEIDIVVTNPDGLTQQLYVINVSRAAF